MTQVAEHPEGFLSPERHLFLSPHYDDVSLSCGGTVALLAAKGHSPDIAVIFGGEPGATSRLTSFAARTHENWGLLAGRETAGRRKEEEAAAAVLGTTVSFLPFLDAIYRGERYLNNDHLFGVPAADEVDVPERIIRALGIGSTHERTMRVYAPLAVGRHVDHQHVFAVGVKLARAGDDVWFYEDLPYAVRPGVLEDRVFEVDLKLGAAAFIDVEATWNKKMAAILAYPSQLPSAFEYVGHGSEPDEIERVMRRYATQVGYNRVMERFWKVTDTA